MPAPKLPSTPTLRVWDLPTRLYHWIQVVLVALALGLGFFAPEWLLNQHVVIGFALVGLILFRLVWGFFGSYYSRFSSFVPTPGRLRAHFSGILNKQSAPAGGHELGHNPVGALMVFGLIFVLGAITITGIVTLGGVENWGPLAGFVDFSTGDRARAVHLALAYVLVVMIVAHIAGVFAESQRSRTSLVRAMVTGDKELPKGRTFGQPDGAKKGAALVSLAGLGGLAGVLFYLGVQVPASGFIQMAEMDDFKSECSDCHELYHPSLLPEESWTLMMAGLEDHFGEDASLSQDTTLAIGTYLERYASEAWDSEAANRLRVVDPENPMQISASPFWKENHAQIPEEVFKTRPVRGTGNCKACHGDAESGRFDDSKISIPEPTPERES